ncbi:hypothetical protein EX30DRAFT_121547 [Ascodesmis nigricans]|uniref:Uncharacterized protein n=1 Tax=Ascodesmis nigricans TaxID=341454 RepID=A0A4S2MSM4_9PEZI|nr:hypothetical protein EX30DRAFT_121547 [Ascodesmis nigricans]
MLYYRYILRFPLGGERNPANKSQLLTPTPIFCGTAVQDFLKSAVNVQVLDATWLVDTVVVVDTRLIDAQLTRVAHQTNLCLRPDNVGPVCRDCIYTPSDKMTIAFALFANFLILMSMFCLFGGIRPFLCGFDAAAFMCGNVEIESTTPMCIYVG